MIFSAKVDLTILEIVMEEEPWRASYGDSAKLWEKIRDEVSNSYADLKFTSQAIKKRFKHLLEVHNNEDSKNRFRSGIYEPYTEQSQLLVQIVQKINFFEKKVTEVSVEEKENEVSSSNDLVEKIPSSPAINKRYSAIAKIEERNNSQIELIKRLNKMLDDAEGK